MSCRPIRLAVARLFKKRVHFSEEHIGRILLMEDGKRYRVIRHLIINHQEVSGKTASVFKVSFQFSSFSPRINQRLSLFPAPFLIAKSEFRQKIWAIAEDGGFLGIYEWATEEAAKQYPQSFVYKLMTKRAAKDSLSCKILVSLPFSNYIESLLVKR